MAINIKSATNIGINSFIVNVEVDISKGLPAFNIIVHIINTIFMEMIDYVKYKDKSYFKD